MNANISMDLKPFVSLDVKGIKEGKKFLSKMEKIVSHPKMRQAMLDASVVILGQETSKGVLKQLKQMVYNQPESEYYKKHGTHRTQDLYRKTQISNKVTKEGENLVTAVVSEVYYAIYVLLGLGPNKSYGERNYMKEGANETENEARTILKNAVMEIAKEGGI